MKTIECEIKENISADSSWDALKIDGFRSGIKIDVRDIVSHDDGFAFALVVGYQVPYEFGKVFQNITNGMVLTLEEPVSGGVGVLRLGDPDVRPVIPNFSGELPEEESSTACFGERFGLQIAARTMVDKTALIYLRVCMQTILSNCVSLNPATGALIHYGDR